MIVCRSRSILIHTLNFAGVGTETAGEAEGSAGEGERNQGVPLQVHHYDNREGRDENGGKTRGSPQGTPWTSEREAISHQTANIFT